MHFMFAISMRNNYVNRVYTVKMRNHANLAKLLSLCLATFRYYNPFS